MIKLYLWANGIIYLLFAIWCTLQKEKTSLASGYTGINNSGWSEYLVIYGGLQLGLAAFYMYLAMHAEYYKVGIIFSLLLYFPIVFYRLLSVYNYWPVKASTLIIAAMEVILLLGAVAVFFGLERSGV